MNTLLARADEVLRRSRWTSQPAHPWWALLTLVGLIWLFGMAYGGVMGAFGVSVERLRQVVYSAVKVPLLLLTTFAISLPSFFVLNSLLGLRRDFAQAVRALVATQAGLAIILSSLAPFTALWYFSSSDYQAAVLFNAIIFGLASFAGQGLLRAYYRPLVEKDARHRWLLWTWLLVYAFVGIQMGWTLRPFIGNPATPPEFFREEMLGNAYEVVLRLVLGFFRQ